MQANSAVDPMVGILLPKLNTKKSRFRFPGRRLNHQMIRQEDVFALPHRLSLPFSAEYQTIR